MEPSTKTKATTTTTTPESPTATIQGIFVARHSAAPMESRRKAVLIPGRGIDGDRYANRKGTYSARFFAEPGRDLTMISSEAVREAFERTGMAPLADPGADLRRNLVLEGISARALNDMVGHEVSIGKRCRVFVHRRCIPCKYREAACKRSGLMNNLWGVSGVNCEVLPPLPLPLAGSEQEPTDEDKPGDPRHGTIRVGDAVAIVPGTHRPEKIDVGRMRPASFVRPADRSLEDARSLIKPPHIAALAALWDPEGFRRVEDAHNSVGQRFWSPEAYPLGLLAATMRIPLLALVSAIGLAFASGIVGLALGLGGDDGAAAAATTEL